MTAFRLVEDAPHPIVNWGPPVAGVIAAGCVAWRACPVPPWHSLSWPELFGTAANYILLVLLVCAGVVRAGYWLLRTPGSRHISWFAPAAASSFAPLAVFLAERSPWAALISALLASSLIVLIRQANVWDTDPLNTEPATELRLMRRLPSSLCASTSIQAGALAAALDYTAVSVTLVGISSAILTWCFTAISEQTGRPSRLRIMALVALAVAFTVGGLARYLKVELGQGSGTGPYGKDVEGRESGQGDRSGEGWAPAAVGETYAGVILWPEIQPKTTLIAPLPAMGHGLSQMSRVRPLSIPFVGAYWFFKFPDRYPPKSSILWRGTPSKVKFTTTDHTRLRMEAHQNFGTLIDIGICSKIQIVINNADRRPGTVSLELILIDTTSPDKLSQSLGKVMVTSTPSWRPADDRPPVTEILTFSIPLAPAIRYFDEATVLFQLHSPRTDSSAKIAIERFLLVPKGAALQ